MKRYSYILLSGVVSLIGFSELIYPFKYNSEEVNNIEIIDYIQSNSNENYILGAGDQISIIFRKTEELNGLFTIGIDGKIRLPRLANIYVEGLTTEELGTTLIDKYQEYLIEPEIYVQVATYRPIRVFVRGEVKAPGSYILIPPNVRSNSSDEESDSNALLKKSIR